MRYDEARCRKARERLERVLQFFVCLFVFLYLQSSGESTACHVGPLRGNTRVHHKTEGEGELWERAFIVVSVGRKGYGRENRLRIR